MKTIYNRCGCTGQWIGVLHSDPQPAVPGIHLPISTQGIHATNVREEQSRIVLGVLAKRGWQLIEDQARFVEQVCAEMRQRGLGNTANPRIAMERAAIRQYCIILHAACGKQDSPRQKRAFEELWRYLM